MILIVDDEREQRNMLGAVLRAEGYDCCEAECGSSALEYLAGEAGRRIRLVLLDLVMAEPDGMAVLAQLRRFRPGLPVLMLTGLGSVSNAVAAMRAGARDFLIKPVSAERLKKSVIHALRAAPSKDQPQKERSVEEERDAFASLIAGSDAMRQPLTLARRAASASIPVLIGGESGVGKEVFARAIYASSGRAEGPFVAVNCGALPRELVESLLFGHEKGAFTGAVTRRAGKFQEAGGGTLFLDEIGELPLDAQVKLLRAIQEGEIDPVGASETVRTDIRLICATNRDLPAMVAAGRFREDLYYRIGAFPLHLPPLRERRDDIAPLAEQFTARFARKERKTLHGVSAGARNLLSAAPWPGNVRQLENVIHRAVVMCEADMLGVEALDQLSITAPEKSQGDNETDRAVFFGPDGHIHTLSEIEGFAMKAALKRYNGSMSEAARRLGVSRSTLYRKLGEAAPNASACANDAAEPAAS